MKTKLEKEGVVWLEMPYRTPVTGLKHEPHSGVPETLIHMLNMAKGNDRTDALVACLVDREAAVLNLFAAGIVPGYPIIGQLMSMRLNEAMKYLDDHPIDLLR